MFMRKPALALALSSIFTAVTVFACLMPSASFGSTRWGLFDAELSADATNQVVPLRTAHGGLAVQLGGGLPLNSFSFHAYGAPYETQARLITLRMRQLKWHCAGLTSVSLAVDGTTIATFGLNSPFWRNYSAKIPSGIDASATVRHTWTVTIDNPEQVGKKCRRPVFIDLGGWQSVGVLTADDFVVTRNPTGVSMEADDGADDQQWMHFTDSATVSATPEISWGESVTIFAHTRRECGSFAKLQVLLGGRPIGVISVPASGPRFKFIARQLEIPFGLSFGPQDLTMTFINPGGDVKNTCKREIDVQWVHGSVAPDYAY